MATTFVNVPPEVAVDISSWLEPRELTNLALASKTLIASPFHFVCFQRKLRLLVPLNNQACGWLHDGQGPLLPQALPTALSITLVHDFPTLHRSVTAIVRTLSMTVPHSFFFKITMEILSELAVFSNLAELKITKPLLQLRHLEISQGTVDLPALVAACPRVQHVEYRGISRVDGACVGAWPPLVTLVLVCQPTIMSERLLREIERCHIGTLERLSVGGILDPRVKYQWPELGGHGLSATTTYPLRELEAFLATLRCLRILRFVECDAYVLNRDSAYAPLRLDDTAPLKSLPLLEELSLGLTRTATDCLGIRALTKLRGLYIVDGWVRDFIQFTPQLQRLRCLETFVAPVEDRTFHRRANDDDDVPPHLPSLEEVIVDKTTYGGVLTLNEYAFRLMEQASSVHVARPLFSHEAFRRISELPKLRSLQVREAVDFLQRTPTNWPLPLRSVSTLTSIRFMWEAKVSFPWDLTDASRLRELVFRRAGQSFVDTIGRCASTLTSLEELDIRSFHGYNLKPLCELPQLVRVRISQQSRCGQLRDAVREGKLQTLQCILHDFDDCLLKSHCKKHDYQYRSQIQAKALQAQDVWPSHH